MGNVPRRFYFITFSPTVFGVLLVILVVSMGLMYQSVHEIECKLKKYGVNTLRRLGKKQEREEIERRSHT